MKRINKGVILAVLLVSVFTAGYGQRKSSSFDWDRVVYGGSAMPYFSNVGTFITANPFIGYKVTEKFVPGILLSYQYTSYNNSPAIGYKEVYNLFGVSPFLRYTVYNNIFAQAEYQFLNGNVKVKPDVYSQSFSENNLFIGGGYVAANTGSMGGLYAQAMYNVTWRGAAGNSVYSTPWVFRIGYTIF